MLGFSYMLASIFSPTEIVELVKKQEKEPFRPTFDADTPDTEPGMFRLMTSCWEEDPDERPSFSDVIKTIVKINGRRSVAKYEHECIAEHVV